jgi:hypothetical protein
MMKTFGAAITSLLLWSVLIQGCGSTERHMSADQVKDGPSPRRATDDTFDAAEPAVAGDSTGGFYLLYVEHAEDKTGDLMLQKFGPDLQAVGGKVRVNPIRGQVRAWNGDPPTIRVGQDGAVYVGWTSRIEGGPGTDLLLSVSRNGGSSFDDPVKVNDDARPASHGMHSLAVADGGRVYMAWLDERNVRAEHPKPEMAANDVEGRKVGAYYLIDAHHTEAPRSDHKAASEEVEPNSEVFFAVSSDGGRSFGSNKLVASNVCACCKTSLEISFEGRIYVGWRQVVGDNFRHIAVTSSSDQGQTFEPPTIVSDDQWQIPACPVSGPALSSRKDGVLEVYWYTAGGAGQPGVYRAASNDFGKTFGPRSLVSFDAVAGTPVLAGSAIVFNETNMRVATQRPGTSGASVLGEGTAPAAATAGGRSIAAFVRSGTSKRSIWIVSVS